jgi:secreted trypsin-like serine protease
VELTEIIKIKNGREKSDSVYFQHGIVSFGFGFNVSAPGVYVRVDYYMDWILANIE